MYQPATIPAQTATVQLRSASIRLAMPGIEILYFIGMIMSMVQQMMMLFNTTDITALIW